MAQINFRIDDGVKAEAESLFSRLGMNMSTAIMVFIRQSIVENGIPFRIKASDSDYERFVQAGRDYENGRVNYHLVQRRGLSALCDAWHTLNY